MNPLQDVFISYGRADSRDFAAKLNQHLIAAGLEVWFDFDDIPLGVDYQKQINDGIEKADNFLFVISPHAINSPYCGLEVELALKRGKRIIPVLHVEEISRETWQQRNPGGTNEQWGVYKAAGKHASYPNMHAALRKINWVYCREGIDDFEQALKGLHEIFQRDRSYVHQHTTLLEQALTWDRNNKRPRNLLVETPLLQAEAWLKDRCNDRQLPCTPTRIHCQFIAESLKNANDGMTDVFLSHAEEDREVLEAIDEAIIRSGFTTWSSWQDIQTGSNFEEAIERGIETADNIVYLLSPAALQSKWCQQEINYALSLNKRIIPLLIEPVELSLVPDPIQALQFIDFTHRNNNEAHDLADLRELFKILTKDADYHQAHKQLLTQALRWERQLKNPCILLKSHALRHTDAWLKVAQKHSTYPPLPLQEAFIQASHEQSRDIRLSVFLAGDSKDVAFARKLSETLETQEERTWFESDRTTLGADASAQVEEAIEQAENFIFIVSDEALQDPHLLADLKRAEQLSKRIIAVTIQGNDQPEPDPTAPGQHWSADAEHIPDILKNVPWVYFTPHGEDFMRQFGMLYRILKSHPQHVQTHTRLLLRALTWEESGREKSALMRGQQLVQAETWLANAKEKTPPPSDLQADYLKASRELASRKVRRRSVFGMSLGATVLVVALRMLGLLQNFELFAYDHLLRQRSPEEPDHRFLVVAVDEDSGAFLRQRMINKTYQPSIGTIPDQALNEALIELKNKKAKLIGLDFYRDFPAEPTVIKTFINTENLIGLCKVSYGGKSVSKPPELTSSQVGFNDLLSDLSNGANNLRRGTNQLRRHLLMQAVNHQDRFCPTSSSFSLLLARRYLEQEGVEFTSPETPNGGFWGDGLKFGETVVPNLYFSVSPYYPANFDTTVFDGYQTLLNFRLSKNPDNHRIDPRFFAETVTLRELLTGRVPQNVIQDRIVLIGYTDTTDHNAELWETPYGEMPGVLLQGQMASQLISAVLDGRSLIRWWTFEQEVLWILAWAIAGGFLVRQLSALKRLVAAGVGGGLMIYILCYVAMVYGTLWISLVPPLAAFTGSAVGVAVLKYRLHRF